MNINPIDISIILFAFILFFIGFNNGVINEFKKSINIFLSIIISQYAVYLLPENILLNNFMIFTSFVFIFIFFIYLFGFILNTIIYNLDSVKIEKNIDKILGGAFGIIRGVFILILFIVSFNFSPIQDSLKNKLINKLNNDSMLFKVVHSTKNFITK